MEQKEQLGGFCLKGHYTSQLSLTAQKRTLQKHFPLFTEKERDGALQQ